LQRPAGGGGSVARSGGGRTGTIFFQVDLRKESLKPFNKKKTCLPKAWKAVDIGRKQ